MKKLAVFLPVGLTLTLSLSGCGYSEAELNEAYDRGYEAGYENGMEDIQEQESDKPELTKDEVSDIVQAYVSTQTVYSGIPVKVGHPVESVSVYSCKYIGDGQWSGQCYAHYGFQQQKLIDWNFNEKTHLVSCTSISSSGRSNPFK